MRMLLKVHIPVDRGNQLVRDGKLGTTLKSILSELKPEAAYFFEEHGERTGLMVVNLRDASEIPRFSEPFFVGLGASVKLRPVMLPEDLAKAEPDLQRAAKTWREAA
ncbi:MAG: hypothetical protein EPN33_14035 [Acidobacteria bacterium]|nr:MAG: hypothetical protein EPN33_14035 [Acidobacteriota bacterium]